MADAHHDFHVVFHQQDGELELLLHELDQLHQFHLFRWVHSGCRFVQQEQLGLGGQGADDLESALIAIRKAFGGLVLDPFQIEDAKQFAGVLTQFFLLGLEFGTSGQGMNHVVFQVDVESHAHVVENRQTREETDILECAGDSLSRDLERLETTTGLSLETHRSFRGLVDPCDQVENGGLASAIGSDQPHQLLTSDSGGNLADRGETAEAHGHLIEFQQG